MQPVPDPVPEAEMLAVAGAVVVPPKSMRYRQAAGVLAADGTHVEQGATRRLGVTLTVAPEAPDSPRAMLAGRWLWCGVLFDHFGHFLIESQARLWNAANPSLDLDGLLFIPKRPRRGSELLTYQSELVAAWGLDLPVHVALEPTRVETLLVPDQAIGLGELIGATDGLRDTARAQFGASVAPDGPERLYVSRSALPLDQGALLLEPAIEAALAQDGYAVFHPQAHDIATQIARYKAARQIVFSDGSTAHLFAYLARPDQQVAVLPRRDHWSDGPIDHIAAFAGRRPLVLPGPVRNWRPNDPKANRNVGYCVHDLPELGAALAEAGMIETSAAWLNPDPKTLEALIDRTVPLDDFREE